MTDRKTVSTGSPYEPIIGISRAVRIGQFIAISGTAPLSTEGKTVAAGHPAEQTRRCIQIAEKALKELGADLTDVIRTRIYLTHIDDWEAVGKVHGEYFGDIRPACTIVQVTRFVDPQWGVEIEFDAVVK
jgi:enamine deaminase RidA (YjgF/YER057c/UK114 family)